ncbi:MAG TPA: SUMF1/EgtB/PvdO family nonheme iron enzyme [Vicinamibacterales bacterium]|jgi:formylglycine-generating enzyme required for sulfatase activity|nr:SUMF1/EgtB/PvdO family nonheme iron enzyme [Vicinamibacterales bacterium]
MPGRIFISYASEDAAVADRIRTGLEQAGVACWIAPRDIEPGTSFPAAITAAIRECTAQVLLLTAEGNASRHVLSEVELAFNAGKPILAVLVGKVTPSTDLQYFISTSHWFDAEASFDDDDLGKLKVDLEKLVAGERLRVEQARQRWRTLRGARPALIAAAVVFVLGIGGAFYFTSRRAPTGPASSAPPGAAPEATPPRSEPAAPAPTPAPAAPAATPSAPSPRTKVNAADGQTYLWIPPGSFAMGCSSGDGDCQPDELPVHTVRMRRGFWLARTEVTNAQYAKHAKTERATGATDADPAVGMDRSEAKKYCAAVGGRLPTEAEWEYAARAGSRERYYDTLSDVAWFENNGGDRSHPVAQKSPNAFGLYDMLGNVYEWVLDRYYDKYDDTDDAVEEPLAPNASAVARGGAWHSSAKELRVSNRFGVPTDYADANVGVRCALNGSS